MKIEPSFPDHWKTKRLVRACGHEAITGLLRLWGQAKIKRQYSGLELNPSKLAAVMDYSGDENALWAAMTDPKAPWIDEQEDGLWAIHGFAEHQRALIAMWENGTKGGRRKVDTLSPIPPIPNNSSSSSSTSSSPCRLPPGNPPVTARFHSVSTPSLKEWVLSCHSAGIEQDLAEEIWHDNEGRGISPEGYWIDYQGNPIRNPLANAKSRASALSRRRGPKHNGKTNGAANGIRDRKELLYDGTGEW